MDLVHVRHVNPLKFKNLRNWKLRCCSRLGLSIEIVSLLETKASFNMCILNITGVILQTCNLEVFF